MKYPYPKDVKEALKQLKNYFESAKKEPEGMLRACKAVHNGPDPDPTNVALNAGWMQVEYALRQSWNSYSQEIRTMITKQWEDAVVTHDEILKVIGKWMNGQARKKEIAAQKARNAAAKNEESPPQFNCWRLTQH